MSGGAVHSAGLGLCTRNARGEVIEVWYPEPRLRPDPAMTDMLAAGSPLAGGGNGFAAIASDRAGGLSDALRRAGHEAEAGLLARLAGGDVLFCLCRRDAAPASVPEAYLKLHLLSHRLVRPHGVDLDGLFETLRTLAWTGDGPVDLEDLPERRLRARLEGRTLDVMSVDKFPKMADYVVPPGVRLADTARIRLGAHIGEGTTVMHEGFVNFNAGTLGAAMVEGRLSAGVVAGENSDLGGGSSTMGTLSGGGSAIVSVGRNCLIGANAGIGFPLPDGCTVEAGLYVTAGARVSVLNARGEVERVVKASELSDRPNLVYRRNSLTGAVEALPAGVRAGLNPALHRHN